MTLHQYTKIMTEEQLAVFVTDIAERCVQENKVPDLEKVFASLTMEVHNAGIERKLFVLRAIDCIVWTLAVINIVEIFAHIPLAEWSIWGILGCSAITAVVHAIYKAMKGDI